MNNNYKNKYIKYKSKYINYIKIGDNGDQINEQNILEKDTEWLLVSFLNKIQNKHCVGREFNNIVENCYNAWSDKLNTVPKLIKFLKEEFIPNHTLNDDEIKKLGNKIYHHYSYQYKLKFESLLENLQKLEEKWLKEHKNNNPLNDKYIYKK